MWHDMAIIILCLWSPSPKYHRDLHRHRHDTMISIILISINVSSHGRLANYCILQLLLSHSDKVKQLHGACILCNNETTIRLLPFADNFTEHDHLIQQIISHHVLTISHHNMPCKNKLDVLYFVVAIFTWLLRAELEPFLPTHQNLHKDRA